ncbi:MAG: nucleoside-diphosphate kinase [candidate division WOR-3 bacterium]
MQSVTQTLLVIKPDAVRRRLVGEIIHRVELEGFEILDMRYRRLTRDEVEGLYEVHRGRDFFGALVDFMMSGPGVALLLEHEDAAQRLRNLVGDTDPAKARSGTIRADLGTSVRENAVHASSPDEDPAREIELFFGKSGVSRQL